MSLPQLPHRGSEKKATAKSPGRTPSANTFRFCNRIPPKADTARLTRWHGVAREGDVRFSPCKAAAILAPHILHCFPLGEHGLHS